MKDENSILRAASCPSWLKKIPKSNKEILMSDDLRDELRELAGYRNEESDVLGVFTADEVENLQDFTITDIEQGETEAYSDLNEPLESYDELTGENLREGETDDPMEAIQEGLSYVPPVDDPLDFDDSADR